MKPLSHLSFSARLVGRRCVYGILLGALIFVSTSDAQDAVAPIQTNDLAQTDPAMTGDASQATDGALDDSTTLTNGVGETNQAFVSGPDGRTRRQRRRPPSRPRLGTTSSGEARTGSSDASGPGSLDYAAFQIIADRNIFDPNRAPRATRPAAAPKTVDSFSLVGTMTYEKGTFAFFDGTSSDFKKVLKKDGSIAGYQVASISPDSVKLLLNTNVLELKVGSQMRRRDDGSWEMAANPVSYASTSSNSQSEAAPSGPESDILKKLMQRREKE
ncbi:MAG TPA: hypothetical protein VKY92_04585 [Verrucomicrobiae bacterium]|nr:hypothetical protein [Verrucomicrobiae bacterium]